MTHATSLCPFCRNESISMSSTVLAHKRRLWHIEKAHPEEEFHDKFLARKGEKHTVGPNR